MSMITNPKLNPDSSLADFDKQKTPRQHSYEWLKINTQSLFTCRHRSSAILYSISLKGLSFLVIALHWVCRLAARLFWWVNLFPWFSASSHNNRKTQKARAVCIYIYIYFFFFFLGGGGGGVLWLSCLDQKIEIYFCLITCWFRYAPYIRFGPSENRIPYIEHRPSPITPGMASLNLHYYLMY